MQKKPQMIAEKRQFLPEPVPLSPPSKVESLTRLPQAELRDWFDNLRRGLDQSEHDYTIRYCIGKNVLEIELERNKIHLPDGSHSVVRGGKEHREQLKNALKTILLERLKNGGAHALDLGTTLGNYVSGVVDKQFEIDEKEGAEQVGYFVQTGHGALKHISSNNPNKTVRIDFNPQLDGKQQITPIMFTAQYGGDPASKTAKIIYHSHFGENAEYPSINDILLLSEKGHQNIIIATRKDEHTFLITEWMPKAGKTLQIKPNMTKSEFMPKMDDAYTRIQYELAENKEKSVTLSRLTT
jgi:hypothetical protein